MQRLEDIHALEVSKADKARWEQVPPREKQEKQVGRLGMGMGIGCCGTGDLGLYNYSSQPPPRVELVHCSGSRL